jgi:mannose-6-phosphate isomerase-like protein (cupin superfamily)
VPDAVAPDGSEIHFRVRDAVRASLVEVVLPAGQTSRPVRHRTVEEIWYFLSGSGVVWVQSLGGSAEETSSVGPGDTVVIPTGSAFQFRAHGTGPLRFLCYTSPPWPGDDEAVPVDEGGLGPPTVS